MIRGATHGTPSYRQWMACSHAAEEKVRDGAQKYRKNIAKISVISTSQKNFHKNFQWEDKIGQDLLICPICQKSPTKKGQQKRRAPNTRSIQGNGQFNSSIFFFIKFSFKIRNSTNQYQPRTKFII